MALLIGTLGLGGCSSVGDSLSNAGENLLVDPAAFAYYRCDDLARALPGKLAREQQLKALIATAEQEAAGTVIAAAAYGEEYARTRKEIQLLAQFSKERHCADAPGAAPT